MVAAEDGCVEELTVAPALAFVAGACEATAVVALGEVAMVDELPAVLAAAVVEPAEFTAAAVAVWACADGLPVVFAVANAAGACAALAAVVSPGVVVPAKLSATATSADFMSRGSSAWNESERNRPPRIRVEVGEFADVFRDAWCQLKNLRIVSPGKRKRTDHKTIPPPRLTPAARMAIAEGPPRVLEMPSRLAHASYLISRNPSAKADLHSENN